MLTTRADASRGNTMSGNTNQRQDSADRLNRRKFIGSAAATTGLMFIKPGLIRGTDANSAVRVGLLGCGGRDRKSTRLNSSHLKLSRMPSSA